MAEVISNGGDISVKKLTLLKLVLVLAFAIVTVIGAGSLPMVCSEVRAWCTTMGLQNFCGESCFDEDGIGSPGPVFHP